MMGRRRGEGPGPPNQGKFPLIFFEIGSNFENFTLLAPLNMEKFEFLAPPLVTWSLSQNIIFHMKLDQYKLYIKIIELNAAYNFVVCNFFI